jgi:hypothetical protein
MSDAQFAREWEREVSRCPSSIKYHTLSFIDHHHSRALLLTKQGKTPLTAPFTLLGHRCSTFSTLIVASQNDGQAKQTSSQRDPEDQE